MDRRGYPTRSIRIRFEYGLGPNCILSSGRLGEARSRVESPRSNGPSQSCPFISCQDYDVQSWDGPRECSCPIVISYSVWQSGRRTGAQTGVLVYLNGNRMTCKGRVLSGTSSYGEGRDYRIFRGAAIDRFKLAPSGDFFEFLSR